MDRLLELLRTHSFVKKRVKLASGRESDFFIDCKQTVLRAEGHRLVGEAMLERVLRLEPRPVAVAGVALGGCSLASSVALTSALHGTPIDALYVRKEAKDHGSQRLIEGDDHLPAGARVAVLEDTITTGGSTLKAVAQLRDRGFEVAGVIAIVDRQEGAAEAIEGAGLRFDALYRRSDFMGPDDAR
ncbi:MAG: orotate phosphoribosyltransferase [Sandaracinaceae bacterium]